ncbi:MAG: integrase family protein [Pseudomonadales bacterium]|jgi:integrase
MALTDTWLRSQGKKVDNSEINKADRDGLYARVRDGRIDFYYRGSLAGKRFKMMFGRYPEVSLKEARRRAGEVNEQVRLGIDPRRQAAADKLKSNRRLTFSEMYEIWHERYSSKYKVRHELHRRSYEIYLKDRFGAAYLDEITRLAWTQYLTELSQHMGEIPIRLLSDVRQVYEFAINNGYTDIVNPLVGVQRKTLGIIKRQRTRVFDDNDLRLFYRALNRKQVIKNKIVMELVLFYGARSQELRNARRNWIDLDAMTFTVPWQFHKTGAKTKRSIVRPIIPEMKHLWEEALAFSPSDKFIFTSMKHKTTPTNEPMSESAFEALPFSAHDWMWKNYPQEEWERWSNHDLRRTARTYWSQWGDWATCEKMLGHKLPGEADVYDRHDYVDQMIPIYRSWWYHLKASEGAVQQKLEWH